ncbi:MAG: CHAT domain-containing protein [Chloroflexota bacterium]
MTPEALVDQLVAAYETPAFQGTLRQLSPHFSEEILQVLTDAVKQSHLRDPNRALCEAVIAEEIAQVLGSDSALAQAFELKGVAHHVLGPPDRAIFYFQQAEQHFSNIGNSGRVAKCQVNQVTLLKRLGHFDEAISLGRRAAEQLAKEESREALRATAILETHFSNIYSRLGSNQEALEAHESSVALFRQLDDPWADKLDGNKALILRNMQRFDEAYDLLQKCRKALLEAGWVLEIARNDLNLGILSYMRGYYQEALQFLVAAHEGFGQVPEPTDMAIANLYRSLVYRELNLLPEMIEMVTVAREEIGRGKMRWHHVLAILNQGVGHARLGDLVVAEKYFTKARRLLTRMGIGGMRNQLDADRAELAWRQGKLTTAVRIAQRVLKQIDEENDPALVVRLQLILARAALDKEPANLDRARHFAKKGRELAERYHLLGLRVTSLALLGEILQRQQHLEAAHQYLQTAVQLIMVWQRNLQQDEFRVGFMADKVPICDAAISVTHELVCRGEMPVSSLVQTIDTIYTPPAKLRTASAPAESAEIEKLRQRWHGLHTQLEYLTGSNGNTPPDHPVNRRQIYEQLHEVEQDIAERLRQMRGVGDAFTMGDAHTPQDNGHAFLSQIQGRLKESETVWYYYVANDFLHALVLTSSELRHVPDLVSVADLQEVQKSWRFHIRSWSSLLNTASLSVAQSLLNRLHQYVVAPLLAQEVECEHIYLILPPAISDLPLSACYDGETYLAEKVSLTYLQALSYLSSNRDKINGKQALVMGHSDGGRLSGTLAEAQWVSNTLSNREGESYLLLEDEATHERLIQLISQADRIHLSTHATFRADNPFFSWIRLAGSRLMAHDLYHLTLEKRPFIFLSACETGKGLERGGTSLGMTRAFLAAGAADLVVTQWPLVDIEGGQFVKDFYRPLLEGASVAQAVAIAQRQAVQRGEHPFFWATYLHVQG